MDPIIDDLTLDLEVEDPPVGQSKLPRAVTEFGGYLLLQIRTQLLNNTLTND